MTTPVENVGFFGVVLTSDGTPYMRPQNTTRPLVNGTAVRLEQGVYRVAASFDGANEVNIRLYSPKLGNPKYWGLREVIGTIPAGGGVEVDADGHNWGSRRRLHTNAIHEQYRAGCCRYHRGFPHTRLTTLQGVS